MTKKFMMFKPEVLVDIRGQEPKISESLNITKKELSDQSPPPRK